MYMFCSIRMAMHRTLLLDVFDCLVRNSELRRQFGFSTVDVIKAQFHICAFKKFSGPQQAEGEKIRTNHKYRRQNKGVKSLRRRGGDIPPRRPPADLSEITGN